MVKDNREERRLLKTFIPNKEPRPPRLAVNIPPALSIRCTRRHLTIFRQTNSRTPGRRRAQVTNG